MEEIIASIIETLGPSGSLIAGLVFIIYRPLKNISESVQQMNHNSTKQTELMREAVTLLSKDNTKYNNV